MPKNRIIVGDQVFLEDRIKGGNIILENSLTGEKLTVDGISTNLEMGTVVGTLFCPRGAPGGLVTWDDKLFYCQPITLAVGNLGLFKYGRVVKHWYDDALTGSFYMTSWERVGTTLYHIQCESAVGILGREKHYGGLYAGVRFDTLVAQIIGSTVPFLVDPTLAGILIYGYLPIDSRRLNLQRLLEATGISLKKTTDGTIQFAAISDASTSAILTSRIYRGGSVKEDLEYNRITVTEHTFKAFSIDNQVTLFEGEAVAAAMTTPKGNAVTGYLVTFNAGPMHDLTVTGATVLESDVNYAVISGTTNGKLTGKSYTHITRAITEHITGVGPLVDKELPVNDNTLITAVNSQAVAARMLSYYGHAKVSSQAIKVGAERPGDHVSFTNPFKEPGTGFIESMDINLSGVLKAETKLVAGYVPVGIGNFYEHREVITADRTFTVPSTSKGKVRVVLVDPGDGGWSGLPGQSSGSAPSLHITLLNAYYTGYGYAVGGEGGVPGKGGLGGKILILDLDVTPGQSFAVHIGRGAPGGAYDADVSVAGASPSSHTTFGVYSAANGQRSVSGYVDPITGEVYGGTGADGIAGGKGSGGTGDQETFDTLVPGNDVIGPDGTIYHPAASDPTVRQESNYGIDIFASNGVGGGAAVGGTPAVGGDGSLSLYKRSGSNKVYAISQAGPGGRGADAVAPAKETRRGFGGRGGHGGGGSGGSGIAATYHYPNSFGYDYEIQELGANISGEPGAGSAGGEGGDGVAIILW